MTSPLKTDAARKATPFAVPTKPLARSRPGSGTRTVTSVERAIARRLPATAPNRAGTTKTQRLTLDTSAKTALGVEPKMARASAYSTREQTLDATITRFLGKRSTSEPRKKPE